MPAKKSNSNSSKPNQSKVKNSKVTYLKAKNEKAESLMRQAFEPLFSAKDGKARLTFCGVQHSILEKKDKKTGKVIKEFPVIKLVFSVFDTTHENPANIALTCDYTYSERNLLGKTMRLMGFTLSADSSEVIDEEDEFGTCKKAIESTVIFDFLRSKCGMVYKANLKVALRYDDSVGGKVERPGLWDIDASTIEPKMLKDGSQECDADSTNIDDTAFTNPEIEMESELTA